MPKAKRLLEKREIGQEKVFYESSFLREIKAEKRAGKRWMRHNWMKC